MIVYRKSSQLRVRRAAAPEPPFWGATTIAPYGARRAAPVAIDYIDLRFDDRIYVRPTRESQKLEVRSKKSK